MATRNLDIADLFEEIADLLELTGQNRFRVTAYRNAARSLRDLNSDVAEVAARGELTEIPGIGESMADHIEEYLQSGRIGRHEELVRQMPPTLAKLLQVPGMGPKKVMAVHESLGVKTLDDLKKALDDGRFAQLPGMGRKTQERIRQGMAFLEQAGRRVPLGVARPVAADLVAQIADFPGVEQVDCAGSLRRGMETVGDLDILCIAPQGSDAVQRFARLPFVERVLAEGPTRGSVLVRIPGGRELQVDLRVVPRQSYGAALLYFTGSKPHCIHLREMAVRKGWKLNEYGLFGTPARTRAARAGRSGGRLHGDGDRMLAGRTEEQIYRKLGLPWIAPQIRQDAGEIEAAAAGELPELLELDDIRGDLHVHTVASDGHNTIEEMARAARDLGYEYLAIADHSRSATIANGLSIDRMWAHIEQIRKVGRKIKGLDLLVSCELDIRIDGSLDYPDSLLAACDFITASLHSGFHQPRETATRRVLAAMENPYVSSIGHLTGRLIGKREPIDLDVRRILEAAARTGTALELNAHPERLDLKDQHVRMAIDAGVMIVINTDAHSTTDLDLMDYGVLTARRGWAQPRHVLNTLAPAALKKWIDRKRRGRRPARAAPAARVQEKLPF